MEILGYNKRCAEFLGWKETTEEFKINWVGCKTKERLDRIDSEYIPILEKNGDVIFPDFSTMDFINDWRWIMEVVEAIEKLEGEFVYTKNEYLGGDTNFYTIDISNKATFYGENLSKKEAVIQAINQFLIWYNNEI